MTHPDTQPGTELLPCPFCGGEEISVYDDRDKTMFWASCRSCGLEAPTETGVTGDDAVAYWNTRATPAQPAGMREADSDRLCDGNFAAGLTLGWNLGLTEDRERFDAAMKSRERHVAALPAERPAVAQAAQVPDDWQDDPSADERWNAGLDFGMVQLCAVLGVDPHMVTWDAATETLDGDVCAAIGNIFRAKYGDDFDPTASSVTSTESK